VKQSKYDTEFPPSTPSVGNVTGKKAGVADVVYVIGSNWKQRFLVKDESTGTDHRSIIVKRSGSEETE